MTLMDTSVAFVLLSDLKSDGFSDKRNPVIKEPINKINESPSLCPKYFINARNTCIPFALISLDCTNKAAQTQEACYEEALATMVNKNVESSPSIYFTSPTCGNTYETKAPKRCGIFMTYGNKLAELS